MAESTGAPSGQKMSSNLQKNLTLQKAFNKELDDSVKKANELLKSMNLPTMGSGGGGGSGNITTSGSFTNTVAKVATTIMGVASSAAQALPGVQEVLGTQLLTSQARFSGVTNATALAQSAMRNGQAVSSTDALQAMNYGNVNGLSGALPGYAQVMSGVSAISNLTGSQQSAMKVASQLNSAQSTNTLRTFGISTRGSNGAARSASDIFKDIFNFTSKQVGGWTPDTLAISLQPGNGMANFLDAAAAGNPELRNALQLAAQQYAQGGSLSRASTQKTGASTAAQGKQSDIYSAKLGTEAAAAPAMSKGFMEAGDLIIRFNKSLTHTLETSKLANDAVKQLAKAEILAADSMGKSAMGILQVLAGAGIGGGIMAGIKKVGSFFAERAAPAALAAGEAGVTAEVVGGAETGGLAGPAVAALAFVAGMIAPSVAKKIISGNKSGSTGLGLHSNQGSSGLGLGASVTSGGTNLTAAGSAVVGVALTQQGVPYSWGGGTIQGPGLGMGSGSETRGFDCSSFTRFVMAKVGVSLPRTAHEQQKCGTQINPKDAIAGDLLFWGQPAHHVAIYMGGGMMIEAPHTGDVVKKTGVNLHSVTSATRVINSKTGSHGVGNLLHAASGYQGLGNYGIGGATQQVTVSDLRGNTAKDAMSGGTSGSSGLGLGADSPSFEGVSMNRSHSGGLNNHAFINTKTGTLEVANGANQTVINYGGVTVEVKVPNGAQVTAQELGKAIKAELKNLSIGNKVATS